jgi:hypothetical protein
MTGLQIQDPMDVLARCQCVVAFPYARSGHACCQVEALCAVGWLTVMLALCKQLPTVMILLGVGCRGTVVCVFVEFEFKT